MRVLWVVEWRFDPWGYWVAQYGVAKRRVAREIAAIDREKESVKTRIRKYIPAE